MVCRGRGRGINESIESGSQRNVTCGPVYSRLGCELQCCPQIACTINCVMWIILVSGGGILEAHPVQHPEVFDYHHARYF